MLKKELIFKIKRKIMEYESKMNSYKKSELEYLNRVPSIYDYTISFNDFKNFDLIYTGIILGNNYDDFESIKYLPEDLIEAFNDDNFEFIKRIYSAEEGDFNDFIAYEVNKYKIDDDLIESTRYFEKFRKILKLINEKDFETISDFFRCIYFEKDSKAKYLEDDYPDIDVISKEERNFILETDNVEEFFDRIEATKKEIKLENKRLNKLYSDKITKLNRLINNLEKNTNGEEITNIDELLDYAGEEFRHDILIYIKENNKTCNEKLERKYLNLKKNSISKFINIFGKNNIDFMLFNDAEKKIIMSRGYDFVERIINFLNKIGYEFKNEILLIIAGTNNDILSGIEEFIKKDYINSEFVRNNINVLLPSNDLDEVSYNLLTRNMNLLLDKGINIKGLDSDGMDFYVSSTELIEDNLSVIEESKVNIKTRNLKNYNFLGEEDLKGKINNLKELGISINSNIEVLNSDINIIKRIKLCNSLGISIYDENNKIKKDILNKDLFFVPDSKIDEYVNEKTLVLN